MDLKSAVVVGLPHSSLKNLPSPGTNEFLDDGPDWHLGAGVWLSPSTCGDVCSDTLETQGFNPPGQGVEEDDVGFAKTFPDIPCVSQMLGGPSLRLGIPRERLSIPPGSRTSGKTQVDW